ncbi:MAG: hypothetical protein EBZ91_12555 [Gammaproteobacteria bacterium]|nr:hypothetical protein [Gammaproteobacteria bacterium]
MAATGAVVAAVVVAVAVLALAVVVRRREGFVAGPVDRKVRDAATAVTQDARSVGCSYVVELLSEVQASTWARKSDKVPCAAVTDRLRRLQNAMEARVQASKLGPRTRVKMLQYAQETMDAVRAAFAPLCRNGTFSVADAAAALADLRARCPLFKAKATAKPASKATAKPKSKTKATAKATAKPASKPKSKTKATAKPQLKTRSKTKPAAKAQ